MASAGGAPGSVIGWRCKFGCGKSAYDEKGWTVSAIIGEFIFNDTFGLLGTGAIGGVGKGVSKSQNRSGDCGVALGEKGEIEIGGTTVEAYLALGLTYTTGEFVNKTTGTYGKFSTFGFGAGFGGGVSMGGGRYKSLSDFVGMGESIGASASIGPVSAGGWRASSIASGQRVGSGGGVGYSAPGASWKSLSASISSSISDTTIWDCRYRP